jgi:hypothetical protein
VSSTPISWRAVVSFTVLQQQQKTLKLDEKLELQILEKLPCQPT